MTSLLDPTVLGLSELVRAHVVTIFQRPLLLICLSKFGVLYTVGNLLSRRIQWYAYLNDQRLEEKVGIGSMNQALSLLEMDSKLSLGPRLELIDPILA